MKKILILALTFIMAVTSISYGLDISSTASLLDKWDLDEWGILALYSAGCDVSGKNLNKVDSSKITTDYEAYILGALPLERDITRYAEKIADTQRSDGKFADYMDGTGNELVNAHIWGIISLYGAGFDEYDKSKALDWLRKNQNYDGGFPVFRGFNNSDLDLTSMAIVAYSILGLDSNSEEVKKAIDFIEKNLDKRESCESVAWYIMARIKLGLDVSKELYDRLLKYRMEDGSFKHLANQSRPNYMASWHGLLAMTDYKNKFSVFTRLHNLNRFSDLKKADYAYNHIMLLVNKGIVSGYPDGTFKSNNPVKRSEFAKFLVYGLNLQNEISEETNDYKDLRGHWANRIVRVAADNGLIRGIGGGKFAPENKITGAEVATILVRAVGLEDKVENVPGQKWYEGYVKVAEENNLLYARFNAAEYATRAQCAEAIAKITKE